MRLDGYARIDRRTKGIQLIQKLVAESRYLIHPVDTTLLRQAVELYLTRLDKGWGLTDCVSFVLMEQEGLKAALTADVHFQQAGFNALLLEGEISQT